jgi:hypothetical protein
LIANKPNKSKTNYCKLSINNFKHSTTNTAILTPLVNEIRIDTPTSDDLICNLIDDVSVKQSNK